jgi:hypothetical protein
VKTAGDSTRVIEDIQKEYTYAYGMVEPRATCGLGEFLMADGFL